VTTTDVTLRPARVDDVDALIAFWRESGENGGRPVDTADAVVRVIARDPEALVVAERGGVIVGTLIIGWDGWRFHLYRLAVDAGSRRQGVAQRLIAYARTRAAAVGAGRIDAMVLDGNEAGAGFWRAAGFRRQDEWGRWVAPVSP
jgi:ribosomal protein S18 acetylase RimI-like enzyme